MVRARIFLALAFVIAAAPARAAVDSWEKTRKTVIDPLNSELHRHLPNYIQARDLGRILELYTTDTGTGLRWDDAHAVYPEQEETTLHWAGAGGPEPIRERYRRMLDFFAGIDKAEVRIHRVFWKEANGAGIPAEVRFIVRGTEPDGSLAQLSQRALLHLRSRDGQWRIAAEEITQRELVTRREPRYVVATEAAGVENVHTNEGTPTFRIVGDLTSSAGSAVADIDGDGCEDFFLAGTPNAALYHNNCDGTFTDATEAWGIPHPYPAVATGVVFFDYDNDGWPDLYVTSITGGDRLFHNLGGRRFVDVSRAAGIPDGRWGSMATVADYDHDGFLDLYVVRMGDHEKSSPEPNYEAANGLSDTLLRNNGDGTFTDVTRAAGVGNTGWGLAAAWGDIDNDGWPDLFVANEFGFSTLYHNRRDGTFRDVSRKSGAGIRTAGMGVAWGDYDGDGRLDIYVSAMYANSRWALFHPDFPVPVPWPYRLLGLFTSEVERQTGRILDELTRGSTLLHNNGDGTFADVSDRAGVRDGQWGWSAEFLDYDNDGLLDLYAVNGFLSGPVLDDV